MGLVWCQIRVARKLSNRKKQQMCTKQSCSGCRADQSKTVRRRDRVVCTSIRLLAWYQLSTRLLIRARRWWRWAVLGTIAADTVNAIVIGKTAKAGNLLVTSREGGGGRGGGRGAEEDANQLFWKFSAQSGLHESPGRAWWAVKKSGSGHCSHSSVSHKRERMTVQRCNLGRPCLGGGGVRFSKRTLRKKSGSDA